jgi:predicted nuclease of predicted toxin-antitoxin system
MRFLLDANMPRSAVAVLASLGHDVDFARDIGLANAPDSRIAARARSSGAALITRDVDFTDVRHYPPADYQGIVVLRLPDDAVAQDIVNLLERFLKQTELIKQLPGHLAILEFHRVRFRPALT